MHAMLRVVCGELWSSPGVDGTSCGMTRKSAREPERRRGEACPGFSKSHCHPAGSRWVAPRIYTKFFREFGNPQNPSVSAACAWPAEFQCRVSISVLAILVLRRHSAFPTCTPRCSGVFLRAGFPRATSNCHSALILVSDESSPLASPVTGVCVCVCVCVCTCTWVCVC